MGRVAFRFVIAVAIASVTAACGDDDGGTTRDAGTDSGGPTDGGGTDTGAPDGGDVDGGGDAGGDTDAGLDAGPGAPCEGGDTHTYVLSYIDLGRPAGGLTPGFNLDGRISDETDAMGCFQADGTSPPPDSIMGVDNQIGGLAATIETATGTDIEMSFQSSINEGNLLILARVSHVDSLENDDCVDLEVMFGVLPEGTMAPMVGGDDRLVAGQTFDLRSSSLMMDRMTALTQIENATIIAGRVQGSTSAAFPMQFPDGMGGTVTVTLRDPQARADISASGLTNGVIGGWVENDELVTAVAGMGVNPTLAMTVIESEADMNPVGGSCEAISGAFVYEATTAVIGMVRDVP